VPGTVHYFVLDLLDPMETYIYRLHAGDKAFPQARHIDVRAYWRGLTEVYRVTPCVLSATRPVLIEV
jgi:hypothetical protein